MRVETFGDATLYLGDCLEVLKTLPDSFIDCCITSPPYYGLRDYGHDDQIGLEETPTVYIERLLEVFREVQRTLKKDGTLWINIGDSYSSHKDCKSVGQSLAKGTSREDAHAIEVGKSRVRDSKMLKSQNLKNKDIIGIPWMLAFALRQDGWYLRQDIIWHKPNPMPESVKDRCTKSHEYIFLLSKSDKYHFDYEAIQEKANYDGRKDTVHKGSIKYSDGQYLINGNANSLSIKGRERWKFKNLQDKGQTFNSFHEAIASGEQDKIYAVKNKRSVWTVSTKPYKEAHFATYPPELITPCVLAGCGNRGIVLDVFNGSGTTGEVALKCGKKYIGIELNEKYFNIACRRIEAESKRMKLL